MNYSNLIKQAISAREQAYCPYSGFSVGAALLTKQNKVYTGCNIESASYSPTNCAERTAFFKAISEGEREFTAIAVIADKKENKPPLSSYISPCGVCRQVMVEFCSGDFEIILAKSEDDYKVYTLSEIMPLSFDKSAL